MADPGQHTSSSSTPTSDDATAATPVSPNDEYYCHHCEQTVVDVTEHFTCPQCGQGFLEKVARRSSDEGGSSDGGGGGGGMGVVGQNPEDFLRHFVASLTGAPAGLPPNDAHAHGHSHGHSHGHPNPAQAGQFRLTFASRDPGQAGASHVHVSGNSFADIISGLLGGALAGGGGGGGEMHGNFGDYAWGEGGLDQIMTNLLNQFEGQAPALSKDEIAAIPKVKVSQEQVDHQTQCSTCMEELKLDEEVLQLLCKHCFHDPCIRPWLETNNTCPICRKVLGGSTPAAAASPPPPPPTVLQCIDELD